MKIYTFLSLLIAMLTLNATKTWAQEDVSKPLDLSKFEIVHRHPYLDKVWSFSIDGGYSHRLGKAHDAIPDDFVKKLRKGFHVGAELSYFIEQQWGVGAKFKARMFSAEKYMVKDRVNIFFVGPVVLYRLFDRRNKNAWVFGFSAGYLAFNEKVTDYNTQKVNAGGFASFGEIGYDIRLSYRTFIGLKMGMTAGNVRLETSPGTKETENASSWDFSVGLRF